MTEKKYQNEFEFYNSTRTHGHHSNYSAFRVFCPMHFKSNLFFIAMTHACKSKYSNSSFFFISCHFLTKMDSYFSVSIFLWKVKRDNQLISAQWCNGLESYVSYSKRGKLFIMHTLSSCPKIITFH